MLAAMVLLAAPTVVEAQPFAWTTMKYVQLARLPDARTLHS